MVTRAISRERKEEKDLRFGFTEMMGFAAAPDDSSQCDSFSTGELPVGRRPAQSADQSFGQ